MCVCVGGCDLPCQLPPPPLPDSPGGSELGDHGWGGGPSLRSLPSPFLSPSSPQTPPSFLGGAGTAKDLQRKPQLSWTPLEIRTWDHVETDPCTGASLGGHGEPSGGTPPPPPHISHMNRGGSQGGALGLQVGGSCVHSGDKQPTLKGGAGGGAHWGCQGNGAKATGHTSDRRGQGREAVTRNK